MHVTIGTNFPTIMSPPKLQIQEIPLDHPESCCRFIASPEKPLLATRAAIEVHSYETVLACYLVLKELAVVNDGLDRL